MLTLGMRPPRAGDIAKAALTRASQFSETHAGYARSEQQFASPSYKAKAEGRPMSRPLFVTAIVELRQCRRADSAA